MTKVLPADLLCAAADNIGAFSRYFVGAKQIMLTQNYRSTGNILAAANAVIGAGKVRNRKVLFTADGAGAPVRLIECLDDDDEAQLVSETARRLNMHRRTLQRILAKRAPK